ncbi:hypothetical protein KBZ07_14615 [Cyanobium sp. BA20m-14]|uniref:hypothetical protein n=1 Tax=Cyanobium sp. BA20m-14 TaxID=2823703 RepID=UPI0020CD61B0|nr:hypothetical protein [Cyanobium sp. BA20m-14]MCP9914608.1 hypothetical protein [Cyanobium sp. BA20m-14]
MNKVSPCVNDYLACREARQVELYRYIRLEKMLKEALDASDAGDLEQKMLQARSQKRHPAATLIALYNEQGNALDKADSLFDAAEALQKCRAAEAQKAMHKDLLSLDC